MVPRPIWSESVGSRGPKGMSDASMAIATLACGLSGKVPH
jgi:hypothetical protein